MFHGFSLCIVLNSKYSKNMVRQQYDLVLLEFSKRYFLRYCVMGSSSIMLFISAALKPCRSCTKFFYSGKLDNIVLVEW